MSWKLLSYTSEQEVRNSLSDLVTVASRTRSGESIILGTAFPIVATESNILMLTASHVIEEGFKSSVRHSERNVARQLNHIPIPSNKPYELMADWVRDTDDLWCLLAVDDKKLIQCVATGICLRPPLDMALLIVDTSQLTCKAKVFPVNSNILQVGDEIVITSLVTEGQTRNLIARLGVITEVKSRGHSVNAPVYQTNIPIEAGASGGPVFRYDGDFNGPKEVIGVISSDISEQDAFSNPDIDGCSYVSMICSAAPLQVSNLDGLKETFQDMCRIGCIQDVGGYIQEVILSYGVDGNWSQKFPGSVGWVER